MVGPIDVIEAKGVCDMNDIQYANNGVAQGSVSIVQTEDTNPHTLWKQILGLGIASIS